jgi:hypothetical protein
MLKPTRVTVYGGDSVRYFMSEVAEAGLVVTNSAASTGNLGNLDDPDGSVIVPTGTVGSPVGVLMNDVVNLDLTRTHLNAHRDEVQLGGKVTVLKIGQVHTNMLNTGDTPVAGDPAHFTTDGNFTTTTTSTQVGTFQSAPDADGYVVVDVRL